MSGFIGKGSGSLSLRAVEKRKYEDHTQYANAPVYLLCHGAYVASDFALVHAYPEKRFVWGYFPAVNTYDLDRLFEGKQHLSQNGKLEIRICGQDAF